MVAGEESAVDIRRVKEIIRPVETGRRPVGLLTGAVREVLKVEDSATDSTLDLVSQVKSGFVSSVAKLEERLLILLDIEQMPSEEEAKSLSEAADGTEVSETVAT